MRIAISSAFVFLIFHVVHPVSSQVLQFEKTPFFSYNAKDCSSAATCFNRKPVVMGKIYDTYLFLMTSACHGFPSTEGIMYTVAYRYAFEIAKSICV